jgi:hypothetical protein
MEDHRERFHYELALALHSTSKAQMLIDMPASELPYWAALFTLKNEEEQAAIDAARG